MTVLHYAYDLSRSSQVHKSVSRYGYPKSGERTRRCEGTDGIAARQEGRSSDVVHSEVAVVPVADQFRPWWFPRAMILHLEHEVALPRSLESA
jgi:hypothetical protein